MRGSLAARSRQAELMDAPSAEPGQVEAALLELDRINRWLGGWGASGRGLEGLERRGALTVLDVGAGGGGTALALRRWGSERGVEVRVALLDLHAVVAGVAARRLGGRPGFQVVRGDALRLPFASGAFEVVHAALLLHHFDDEGVVAVLHEMRRVARVRVVVNDLRRSAAALGAIWALTRVLSRSRFVRHDAPVSVRRGFREDDLERVRRAGPFPGLTWRRRWPYRWILSMDADGHP